MDDHSARFVDRFDAGALLAVPLASMSLEDPVVYALPRGGIPVGIEVARALGAPLELVLVRKIGAPGQPELALAAVVDGDDAVTVVNEAISRATGADTAYLNRTRREALAEIERRRSLYLGRHPRIDPKGRTAIVVDDGLATGATAKAALRALRRRGAKRTILAIPVAPAEALAEMADEADEIVCILPAERFRGVGGFYDDFHQMSDVETTALLRQVWREPQP